MNTNLLEPERYELDKLLKHYQNSEFVEAEKLALTITKKFPNHSFSWKVLGSIYEKTERKSKALIAKQKAIEINPKDAEAYCNLGNTFQDLARLSEAEESFREAIKLKPDFAEAFNNLGNTLRILGKEIEAEICYRKAISLKDNFAEAYNNLAKILHDLGKLEEAEENYKRALSLKPDLFMTYNNLAHNLFELGKIEEAENVLKKAIELKPDLIFFRSNLLFLQSATGLNSDLHIKEAKNYGDLLKQNTNLLFSKWSCDREPEALRVGFVSADFKNHPIGFFLEGFLKEINDSSLKLYAYSLSDYEDNLTERIKPIFNSWTKLHDKNDDDAAKIIHNDRIHILIDLMGHTVDNRLPIFSRKPAPIQVTWLGYWATTGLKEITYILGDPYVTSHDESNHFIEKIWQLPESFFCYTHPSFEIKVKPLPAITNNFITFGCFNNLNKMNDGFIKVLSEILTSIPKSKLFIKNKQLEKEGRKKDTLNKFIYYGINEDRIILEGRSPRRDYFDSYNRVDINLSPFPYGGGTTSIEGLWMGVPVLTKKGSNFVSHIGESIAHNSGISDWIADDNDDYISKAINFSSKLNELANLRKTLRNQVLLSPLFDKIKFSRYFENALWGMWKDSKN